MSKILIYLANGGDMVVHDNVTIFDGVSGGKGGNGKGIAV